MKRVVFLIVVLMMFASSALADPITIDLDTMTLEEIEELIDLATEKKNDLEEFTVDHDEEYKKTKQYIWDFLEEKGYKGQTIIGTPNIGRYEDLDTTDNSEPWYAYVKFKGEWTEFIVLVENGEVTFIRPNK